MRIRGAPPIISDASPVSRSIAHERERERSARRHGANFIDVRSHPRPPPLAGVTLVSGVGGEVLRAPDFDFHPRMCLLNAIRSRSRGSARAGISTRPACESSREMQFRCPSRTSALAWAWWGLELNCQAQRSRRRRRHRCLLLLLHLHPAQAKSFWLPRASHSPPLSILASPPRSSCRR